MVNMALINLLTTTPKIKTDIHSHLLPGIDDGAQDFDESLQIISLLSGLGYERLVITPHVMSHRYNNATQDILCLFDKLKTKLSTANIDIKVHIAAEYYLDEYLMELIEKQDILTFSDNFLLFELSFSTSPLFLDEAVFLMQSKGYKPILAHPERYVYMHKDLDKYIDLKDRGVLFQININSFSGYYSLAVKRMAERMLKSGIVDFLGSDAHNQQHINVLKASFKSLTFRRYFKHNPILNDKIHFD